MSSFEANKFFQNFAGQQFQQDMEVKKYALTQTEASRVEYERRWQRQYQVFEDVMAPTMEKFFGDMVYGHGGGAGAERAAGEAKAGVAADIAIAEREAKKKVGRAAMDDARRAEEEGRAIVIEGETTPKKKGEFEGEEKSAKDEGEKKDEGPKTGMTYGGGTRGPGQKDVKGMTEEEWLKKQEEQGPAKGFPGGIDPTASAPSATRGAPSQQKTDPPGPPASGPRSAGGLSPEQQANIDSVRQAAQGMVPEYTDSPTTTFSVDAGGGKSLRLVKDPYSDSFLAYTPGSTEPTIVSPATVDLFLKMEDANSKKEKDRAALEMSRAAQAWAIDKEMKGYGAARVLQLGIIDDHVAKGNLTPEQAEELKGSAGYLDARTLHQLATGEITTGQARYSASENRWRQQFTTHRSQSAAITNSIYKLETDLITAESVLEGARSSEDNDLVAKYEAEIRGIRGQIQQRRNEQKALDYEFQGRYDPSRQAVPDLSYHMRSGMTPQVDALLRMAAADVYGTDPDRSYDMLRDPEQNGWEQHPEFALDFYESFASRARAAGWENIPGPDVFFGRNEVLDKTIESGNLDRNSPINLNPARGGATGGGMSTTPPSAADSQFMTYNPSDPYWTSPDGAKYMEILNSDIEKEDAIAQIIADHPNTHIEDLPPQLMFAIQELYGSIEDASTEETTDSPDEQD